MWQGEHGLFSHAELSAAGISLTDLLCFSLHLQSREARALSPDSHVDVARVDAASPVRREVLRMLWLQTKEKRFILSTYLHIQLL